MQHRDMGNSVTPSANTCALMTGPLRRVTTLCCVHAALVGPAYAADGSEVWPELSAYISLAPDKRLYLDTAYAHDTRSKSTARSLDVSAFLDLSIKPILREELHTEDWQRARYLWARVGYTRVLRGSEGPVEVAEDRAVVSMYAKAPVPAEVWLEARARADLRWMQGDYSTRYRFKLEASREFSVHEHAVVPYFNAEAFFDTRYNGLSRALYQVGTEITVSQHFRYEAYLAWQSDRQPARQSISALGLVAKWYY
jgi:hypothetical protein